MVLPSGSSGELSRTRPPPDEIANSSSNVPTTKSITTTTTTHDPSFPQGYSHLHLAPATRQVVTTTTTTTTVHFAPILLPKASDTSLASLRVREDGYGHKSRYPLASLPPPKDITEFKLSIGDVEGCFKDRDSVEEAAGSAISWADKGKGRMRDHHMATVGSSRLTSRRKGHARERSSQAGQRSTQGIGIQRDSAGPPRKRPRSDDGPSPLHLNLVTDASGQYPPALPSPNLSPGSAAPAQTNTSLPPNQPAGAGSIPIAMPQQQPSPNVPDFSPASPAQTSVGDEYQDDRIDDEHFPVDAPAAPSQPPHRSDEAQPIIKFGGTTDLSALFSLPSLVSNFSTLDPSTQSYILFQLLRQSSVQVLQNVNNVITPALKRDFLADLPPELSVQVLSYLDGSTLCRACRVSKKWRRLVDGERKVWRQCLVNEDLWMGDGEDENEPELLGLPNDGKTTKTRKEELFLARWKAGVWDEDFDQGWATKSAAEKVREVMAGLRTGNGQPTELTLAGGSGLGLDASTETEGSSSDAMQIDRNEPIQARPPQATPLHNNHGRLRKYPTTMNVNEQRARTEDSVHFVDPYKLLYRRRTITRGRWAEAEPQRLSFPGHGNNVVTCLQFDKDKFVSASDDHCINVFDTKTGRLISRLDGHEGGVWALQYVGNTLVSGSTDRTIRVWDLEKCVCTHVFQGHSSTVRCLQIVEPQNINPDPNGPPVWEPPYPLIVTGSRDFSLRVWKLPNQFRPRSTFTPMSPREEVLDPRDNPFHLRALEGHTHAVRALAAHGRTLVSGSYDHHVRVWDILTGECKSVLRGHSQKVYSIILDHKRKQCASGSMDGTIRLWSIEFGQCLRVLSGHSSLVGLLGLSRDHLVSAAADSTLRVWNAVSGECEQVLTGHAGAITCFQHDESKVVSGSDGTLKMWNVKDGSFTRDLVSGLSGVWQVAFDEQFCVAAVQRNGISEFEILDFGVVPDEATEDRNHFEEIESDDDEYLCNTILPRNSSPCNRERGPGKSIAQHPNPTAQTGQDSTGSTSGLRRPAPSAGSMLRALSRFESPGGAETDDMLSPGGDVDDRIEVEDDQGDEDFDGSDVALVQVGASAVGASTSNVAAPSTP